MLRIYRILILILLLLGISSGVYAAETAPKSFWRGLRYDMQRIFIADPVKSADFQLRFAEERFAGISQFMEREEGRPDTIAKLTDLYLLELGRFEERLAKVAEKNRGADPAIGDWLEVHVAHRAFIETLKPKFAGQESAHTSLARLSRELDSVIDALIKLASSDTVFSRMHAALVSEPTAARALIGALIAHERALAAPEDKRAALFALHNEAATLFLLRIRTIETDALVALFAEMVGGETTQWLKLLDIIRNKSTEEAQGTRVMLNLARQRLFESRVADFSPEMVRAAYGEAERAHANAASRILSGSYDREFLTHARFSLDQAQRMIEAGDAQLAMSQLLLARAFAEEALARTYFTPPFIIERFKAFRLRFDSISVDAAARAPEKVEALERLLVGIFGIRSTAQFDEALFARYLESERALIELEEMFGR